jgi:protein-S-isoprenylcysteine O-methyltransferase Ste14
MRATKLEFRLRFVLMVAIVGLGFWSPWIEAWGMGQRIPLLEWLALELSRAGLLPFTLASPVVIGAASLLALGGAVLRVSGTAYLGAHTVLHGQMQGDRVVASGPYRFVRNPLYLGILFMMAAMGFAMPPTGAVFTLALVVVFLLRLILAEEAHLTEQMGETYKAYLRAVPRLLPRLRTNVEASDEKAHWVRAVLNELAPIGVFIALSCFSWTYNNETILRAILVSFGVSLVVRALMKESRVGQVPAL